MAHENVLLKFNSEKYTKNFFFNVRSKSDKRGDPYIKKVKKKKKYVIL